MVSPGKNKVESLSGNFLQNSQEELQEIGQLFQVAIRFHPCHPQAKMIDTSFCALVGLFLTKLNHYFNVSIRCKADFFLQSCEFAELSLSRRRLRALSICQDCLARPANL